ncbi:MAG: hypothetical protein HGA80_09570, partial [Candidatus Omnitrophica bacterium]|nr:hypothetical protein [Candidatus Omnitrophota bacterium]
MRQLMQSKVLLVMAGLLGVGLLTTLVGCGPEKSSKRIMIDSFDSADAPSRVEYGAKVIKQLSLESSTKSATGSGRSLKLNLKLLPDTYNFLASGEGLADPKFGWENPARDVNWNDIVGISYKIFVESINGAPEDVSLIRLATDVIDRDGEILRNRTMVNVGEWLEVRVYFQDVLSRADYQRDWKSVKRIGPGTDAMP